jgi:SAM-dependent methyltransferase
MEPFEPLQSYSERGLNPDRLAAIRRDAGATVVDVGCGSGAYVLGLDGGQTIWGADRHRFSTWTERPSRFIEADATRLPLRSESVDTLLVFETLEHLADPAAALHEYLRVCRRNVLLTVPNCRLTPGLRRSNLIFRHWIDPTHRNYWDLDGIAGEVRTAGFLVSEQRLINQIDLTPLLLEALRLPSWLERCARPVVRRLLRPYRMTCLIVATKPSSPAARPLGAAG